MKRWAIIGGVVVVAAVAVIVVMKMSGTKEAPPPKKVEEVKGPDPALLARIAAFAREAEECEAKGDFKEALDALKSLAKLEPSDPRPAAMRPRLEEKLKRWEAWRDVHQKAEIEKKEALRINTTEIWHKVLALIADAERLAPMERFQSQSRALLAQSRQYHLWAQARDEEKKANFNGAIDLAGQAIAAAEPPAGARTCTRSGTTRTRLPGSGSRPAIRTAPGSCGSPRPAVRAERRLAASALQFQASPCLFRGRPRSWTHETTWPRPRPAPRERRSAGPGSECCLRPGSSRPVAGYGLRV